MSEIVLFIVCLICLRLKKSYCELAENAVLHGRGNPAKNLRIVLKHTGFLNFLFDLITLVAFSFFVLLAAFDFDTNWAGLVIFFGLVLVFILLPVLRPSRIDKNFAASASFIFAYFIAKLEKPISRCEEIFARIGQRLNRPQPMSRQGLKNFLKSQQEMPGQDQDLEADLKLALAGLDLNTQKASYIMQRLNKTRSVQTTDQVGPVLLSELHATGRKIFPAKENKTIIGTLRLDKLTELKTGGKAGEALDPQVVVANKDETVLSVIKLFVESAAELVFLEDDSGHTVGAIYLEDVLKELI